MKNNYFKNRRRYYVKLELGQNYEIEWNNHVFGPSKIKTCKLVRATQTGFAFINLDTNKGILKRLMYRSKKPDHIKELWFMVNSNLILTPIYEH